jgi:RNA polymerase sigma factor (sigma-70 family)
MSGTEGLLTEYANGGSERAFRDLVSSYVNFVFSTALRILGGDRPLAEDVTQAVFTDLARKARSLPKDVQLGGWLHRHTCFVARKTLRRERRRIAREKVAVELHSIEDYTEANLAHLALVLDEVINDLGEDDRNAIVLRFFEERDFRSIGEALGISEDAARMRVSRSVEKMGTMLKRRGIVLTVAGISFVLSGKLATAAPSGLATRIVYIELARPVKGQGIFEILREACLRRLNIGIVSAAVIVALLALLVSGRTTGAKTFPRPDGNTFTPAEFADLGVEESDDQNAAQTEVASTKPETPPAPSVAPRPGVAPTVQRMAVKPVVAGIPRAMPPQVVTQATPPTASVPMDSTGAGQVAAGGQGNQYAKAWGQSPVKYGPPLIAPQTPPPRANTNSASAVLVNTSPSFNPQSGPWSSPRTMATIEAGTTTPNAAANQSSIQSMRTAPRSLPPSRSNDPRKRDRQP